MAKFTKDNTVGDVAKDPVIGKYVKYICYDYVPNVEKFTIEPSSYYAVDGFNFLYEQALSGNVNQYFLNPKKPDINVIHISHKEHRKFFVICSGGGLNSICHFHEGLPMASLLFKEGFDVFLLTYSINEAAYKDGPSEDLNAAVKFIFENAEKLNIDTKDFGIMGGSAGSYVVAQYGTKNHGYLHFNNPKPAVLCILYPVVDFSLKQDSCTNKIAIRDVDNEDLIQEWSPVRNVYEGFPPCFIAHSKDDQAVPIQHSYNLISQLEKYNIPYKFNEYKTGGHGWSIGKFMEPYGWFDDFIIFYRKIINER